MALSKDEIQLLKEMIADDSISKQEKDMYREMLGETPATASQPAKKKATKKKSTPKKKKVSESDIDKMKAQIKQRTGKTEEECEKIVDEYRALRKKATTRKKKETATKEKSKQRTTKLKKEGKVIEGTTEKNVEATIDTATKTATKKVDKEITKIEKSTKGEKQVEKKIDQLVKKALASSKKFVSDMAKELSTKSKTDGKTYLLGLRSQIDALLKKYELGGEVFDGSGDSINFGSGGFTSSYNIQDGMISVGNNVKFEEGGDVFDGSGDSVNFAKGGKIGGTIIHSSDKYGSDYWIDNDGDLFYRPMGSNEEWSLVSEEAFSESERKEFDKEMKKLFGKKINFAKGGKVYAIDIDLENGEQPRESKFQYTHNEFGLHQAKEHFNRLKKEGVYEYNDIKEPIENIQLLEVDNDNDDYRVIDSEFFAKGGKIDFSDKNNYRNTSGKPNWDKISEKDLKKNYKKMDNDFRDRISYKEFKEIFIEQDVEVYAKGGDIRRSPIRKLAFEMYNKEYNQLSSKEQKKVEDKRDELMDKDYNSYKKKYFAKGGMITEESNYDIIANVKKEQGESDFYYALYDKLVAYGERPKIAFSEMKEVFDNYDENMSDYIDLPFAKGGEVITDSFGDKYELREDEEININDYVYFGDTGDISLVEDEEDLEFARAGKTKAVPFAKGGSVDKDLPYLIYVSNTNNPNPNKQLVAKVRSKGDAILIQSELSKNVAEAPLEYFLQDK